MTYAIIIHSYPTALMTCFPGLDLEARGNKAYMVCCDAIPAGEPGKHEDYLQKMGFVKEGFLYSVGKSKTSKAKISKTYFTKLQ